MIYLDYAASSKIHPKALETMNNCWNSWANPSSMHKLGKKNRYILESCRESLKNIFNVQNNAELYFTSSASEANNLVLNSTTLPILISPFEHPSIANFPKVETFNIETLEEKLKEKQYLVCISLIHNETGMLIATKEIISLIKKYNSKLLIDASQAKNINFSELNCDYLTISSHKIGGPIGISCLISKTLLKPLIYGGGQEFNVRSSTEALPLIVGFTAAANELKHQKYDHFYTKIEQKLSKKYIFNTFSDAFFEKHIVCLLTYDIPGTEVFAYMDMNNIAVSYGSACSSGTLDKLKILNIDHSIQSKNAIRISFGFYTKIEEIDKFCSVFCKFIS